MRNRNWLSSRSRPRAFTLVELLIVIGIIALLVAILLPAANRIRIVAKRTQTMATINMISQGCEAYFTDFGAYPGTFANGLVLPNTLPNVPSQVTISFTNYPGSNPTATPQLTSTENMVLSLLGGLNGNLVYDFNAIGQGAASLNPNKPGRSHAYIEIRPTDLTTTYANPSATGITTGQWTTSDSPIPEILDNFSAPQPILYMRAYRGNSGYLNVQTPATVANPQYDITQLGAYGFPTQATTAVGSETFGDWYKAVPYDPTQPTTGTNIKFNAGPEAYFGNAELTTSAANLVPIHKDQFILISAGPDGIFGTADDIHN